MPKDFEADPSRFKTLADGSSPAPKSEATPVETPTDRSRRALADALRRQRARR
jgi:hypothetical protein